MVEDSPSQYPAKSNRFAQWWIAIGIFFVTVSIYVLSSPGRIDIIDGQARYDVTYNWLSSGRPLLRDPWIGPLMSVPGRDGLPYSYYGAPASIFSMPLVWLGSRTDAPAHETSRFLFSLASAFFGSAIAVVLFAFYIELGLSLKNALMWTMVNTFATLVWPLSTSTFDNAQHAFFVLLAAYLGILSARHNSRMLAVTAGFAAGILVLYQEYFVILLPALAITTVQWTSANKLSSSQSWQAAPPSKWAQRFLHMRAGISAQFELLRSHFCETNQARASCIRFLCFLGAAAADLALYFAYNSFRFGSYFHSGKLLHKYPPLFGNPLAGFATLLFSPGKSIFLYSPPIVLAVFGVRYLWRRKPELTFAIVSASTILVLFISCISFAGGDWCWGPRYLVVVLPLWALVLPFASLDGQVRRDLVLATIGIGVVVQLLALSVENQRFFFARGLNDFFWAQDPWFYFKHSALFARVGEVFSMQNHLPPTARLFNSIPIPEWSTYAILGPPPWIPRSAAPQWMLNFKIYYLPRPWPLWMPSIQPALRPINFQLWLWGLLGILTMGIAFIQRGFSNAKISISDQNVAMEPEVAQS